MTVQLLAEDRLTQFHSYPAVVTSPQVWDAIRERHEVKPFSSFSDPTGTFMNGPGEQGRMETTYGLLSADYPLIGARTRWRIDPKRPLERFDIEHTYYLIVAMKEQE